MKAIIKNNKLIIEADIDTSPRPSRSGKTLVGVSTNGFVKVESDDNKEYSLNMNLTIKR